MKRLYRSQAHKLIAGICGGLAEYVDMDPTCLRLIFCVFILFGLISLNLFLILYFIAWIIIPVPNQSHNSHIIRPPHND